jgi:two-component system, OmpR family, phosphate regulon sensor histidine kinase PhoR
LTTAGIESVARELAALTERLEAGTADADTLMAALEGLRTSLEEFQIVDEELTQRADELSELHALVDGERRRYHDLFASAPTPYVVTDLMGKILETNAASAELFGIAERFLAGKPISAFVSVPDRREFRRFLIRIGPEPVAAQFRLERRGGVAFDASVTVAPVVGGTTRAIESLRWVIRDVTAERLAQRRLWELNADLEERVEHRTTELRAAYDALSAQRAQFEAIVQNLPAAVVVADEGGRVVVRNSLAEELFGDAVAKLDTLADRLLDPDGRPISAVASAMFAASDGDADGTLASFALEQANGERLLLEATVARVLSAAGHMNLVYVFHDVTAQRRRDVAQREFVVNAAHELRTPLAAIVGAVEVLQAGGKDDAETRDIFLAHIERESNRLVRLARSLLLLSRTQAHEEHPVRELVPLRQILEDVAEGMRPAPAVTVEVQCDEELAALINEDLFRQALSSLADNAARYTERGTITLVARGRDDNRVAVEIVDTGPGLSGEERTLVTHRFVRGSRSTEGFGLGLSIAAEAARAAGAELELESNQGQGTTARIVAQLARLVTV